jgi:hypothetical protein
MEMNPCEETLDPISQPESQFLPNSSSCCEIVVEGDDGLCHLEKAHRTNSLLASGRRLFQEGPRDDSVALRIQYYRIGAQLWLRDNKSQK